MSFMTGTEAFVDCGQGVRLVRGRAMQTRDGVTLVSDHYLPPGPGPHPTLLMRQPYGRAIASTVVYAHPVWFARHGYHVVIQDVRGRGDSEGDFYPFCHEGPDGYDAVQWAAGLPESNGRVAMYGFSYQGMTQFLAAAEQPPALVAIAPAMSAVDLYHGWFYHNGLFKLAAGMGWGTQMLRFDATRRGLRDAGRALEKAWAQLAPTYHEAPYDSAPHLTAEGLPTYYRDWVTHDRPGIYWQQQDISARLDRITVPTLHLAGWYDMFSQGTLDGYTALRQKAGTAHARENQYLVAGPWLHIPWGRLVGELDFGPEALVDTDAILLAWFDHWLKGDDSFAAQPRVRAFAMGENRWHDLEEWPPTEATAPWQSFFLHSEGGANSLKGNGTLAKIPPITAQNRDLLMSDLEAPVSAPGGPMAAQGSFRQDRIEAGNNVLVYTSPALEKLLAICGQPKVRLHVSSSTPQCDLIAKLLRVDASGGAWNLCLGGVRATALFSQTELLADTVRLWEFSLESTFALLQPGEKIRLEIASTCFPLFDRSSNRLDLPAREAGPGTWRYVTHQLLHEPGFLSTLELPVLPD